MHAHHAYYIEGSSALFDAYKQEIPHFVAQKYDRFGVDEARALAQMASLKNVSGEAVFFIALSSITSEAQQALLKLFEEPQQGTVFVLLLPHGSLVPTLKSRMMAYPKSMAEISRSDLLAKQFLQMGGKERSDYIAKMLKDEDGLKERVRDFVNALEVEVARLNLAKNPAAREGLEDIAMVRDYLADRSPSLKMLLEHLALLLPSF